MKAVMFSLLFIFGFMMVNAVAICIDLDEPSAPQNLTVSGNVGNIILSWLSAIDTPDCGGILEYRVNRDGILIGTVDSNTLSFVDSEALSDGEYQYTVFAVDRVGNNEGQAIKNTVDLVDKVVRSSSRGNGRRGSSLCVERWECDDWLECSNEEERRACNDLKRCGTSRDKPETLRSCGDDSNSDGLQTSSLLSVGDFEDDEKGFFSVITGGVIGTGEVIVDTLGETGTAVTMVVLIAMLCGSLFVIRRKIKR